MPPKARITADMIAEAGLAVVRCAGEAALNIRSVAMQLGCSTQPVMYHYSTAGALRAAVYAKADAFHSAYLMQEEPGNPLLGIGLRYIRFAAREGCLFRFLFQSGGMKDTPLALLTASPDSAPFVQAVADETGLNAEQAEAVFTQLFMTVHGCASLLANNAMQYDEAYCGTLLTRCLNGAVAAMKGEAYEEAL